MKIDTKLILNMLTGKAEQETLDYVLQEISFYKPISTALQDGEVYCGPRTIPCLDFYGGKWYSLGIQAVFFSFICANMTKNWRTVVKSRHTTSFKEVQPLERGTKNYYSIFTRRHANEQRTDSGWRDH